MMRCLLVSSAHYILGPFGPDCDLRRRGLKLTERKGGGRKPKMVARCFLWATGEQYEPLYNARCRKPPELPAAPQAEQSPWP